MVKYPNQLGCYINRKERHGEQFVNFITEDTYNILTELGSYGAVLVYFYLCAQVPHTYDGKNNSDCKDKKPFGISPKGIREAYGNKHDIKTYQDGINRLIDLGILQQIRGTTYHFDDLPLKYRVKTYEEKQELDELSAEEAFQIAHKQQIQDFYIDLKTEKEQEQSREKYEWED